MGKMKAFYIGKLKMTTTWKTCFIFNLGFLGEEPSTISFDKSPSAEEDGSSRGKC